MQHQRNPLLSVLQKIQLLYIKHPPERNQDENEEEYQNLRNGFRFMNEGRENNICVFVCLLFRCCVRVLLGENGDFADVLH